MRPTATLLLLLAPAALWAQFGAVPVSATTAPAAKVKTSAIAGPPRQEILQLEKLLDTRLYAMGTVNDPVDMLGLTRGIYLSNYGAVFSSEISLVISPGLSPFRPTISKELAAQVHKRKLDRLPALRKTLNDMMQTVVKAMPEVPDSQLFVVAVRLDYLGWEDRTGLPGQLMATADRKSALAGNIQVTEEQ